MKKNLFFWFWGLGLMSVVFVQTSFVPDEYWQSLEIAHRMVFGYGKITWEWKEGIRSSAYPLFIAIIYKILAIFNLDNVNFLIYIPRFIQATISAVGYLYTCKISSILYGKETVMWTAATLSSSWFLFYCMSRTLYNTIETVFIIIALRYYLWNNSSVGNHFKYIIFAAFSVIIRPTSAIIWIPLSIYQLIQTYVNTRHLFPKLVWLYILTGFLALSIQVLLDFIYYRQWMITPINFFKFNFLSNQSSHYGTQSWHWYLTQGLPTVLTTHIFPLVFALRNHSHVFLSSIIAWIISVYSISSHKEFRFILPIVPLCCCIVGCYLKKMNDKFQKNKSGSCNPNLILLFLFVTNIPLSIYFGMYHQRGTLDAIKYLASDETPDKIMNVLFLMPCHSTPGYSHIHRNISLRFLSCEPNLNFVANYQDESDIFYANPKKWLSKNDLSSISHVVIFDNLWPALTDFLNDYKLCAKFFHSHFSDDRIGYANYAYNRKSVSLTFPALMDAGLSKDDAGLIASSQNLAFAISKFLGGVLSDKVSARILFASGLFLSGTVTILFPSSNSLSTDVLLWFLNGIGQGAGWPAAAKVIRHWSPPDQFGTWWSVISASTNVSGAITPFLAAFLIINYGWKSSLIVSGTLSIATSLICLLYVVNSPTDLGWLSFVTQPKKEETKSKESKSEPTESWRDIIKSPFLWLLSICYMVVFCVKTSAVDWGQMYLHDDLHHSHYVGSAFTSSLESGGFVGGVASGYITDWLMSRPHNRNKSPRMPTAFIFTVGVAVGLHIFCFRVTEESTQVFRNFNDLFISCVGFFLGACLYGSISIFGVVAAETAPPHLSGTAHAIVALAANIGGVVSGLPFSLIAKFYNWCAIFILLEIISVLTVLVMTVCWNMHGRVEKLRQD